MKRNIANQPNHLDIPTAAVLIIIAIIYLTIRYAAWSNPPQLEDHDSVGYISQVEILLSADVEKIIKMNPDSTPIYPLLVAGVSSIFGNVEASARWVSFLFSFLLFIAIFLIGRRFSANASVAVGLFLLAFNPEFVRISYSVLTESTYIAIVYFGIWQFFKYYESPNWKNAAWLGLIFSLAFLCRMEGILFLAAIPFIQLLHFLFSSNRTYSFQKYIFWCFSFIASFVVLMIPQVWRVSNALGQFAINGREVWSVINQLPGDGSIYQKVYSLTFDPGIINLHYLREHPEALNSIVTDQGVVSMLVGYVSLVIKNMSIFYNLRLGESIGPAVLIFFGVGLFILLVKGKRFYLLSAIIFLAVFLTAPFLHNVVMRHIIIIGPFIMLIAGMGVVGSSAYIANAIPVKLAYLKYFFVITFTFAMVAFNLLPLRAMYILPDETNAEYRSSDYEELIATLEAQPEFSKEMTRIVARKNYIGYFAGAKVIPLPYTDYLGLVKYLEINQVDYLLIEESHIKNYPYLQSFISGKSLDRFKLITSSKDYRGNAQMLYAFVKQ